MARLSRYFLPRGIRRLSKPILMELKLFLRVWLNLLLPHRLIKYRRLLNQPEKRLHIGCGSKLLPGWINLDMNPKGDLTLDLREGLPFADNSVDLIYTEHSMEHFYREDDGPFLLQECLRTLQPGATIRITVPDAAVFMDYYVGKLSEEVSEGLEREHHRFTGTRMDVVNSAFRWKHQHLYMYDEETLRRLLQEVGFSDIERRGFRESSVEELSSLDLEERRGETLYMEARKPELASLSGQPSRLDTLPTQAT
ncbi:MAG: class I SAM-dependent methyltransferase [Planctomycetota bacterium]|jgi:predicted SAM-dependent methyltransferase